MDKLLRTIVWTAALVLIGFQTAMAPVLAQDTKLKKEELDQLLAPIALYPDDLLDQRAHGFDLPSRRGPGCALEKGAG